MSVCPKCGSSGHRCKSGALDCMHCDNDTCTGTWFEPTESTSEYKHSWMHITDLMFRDTKTARMLRRVCEASTMRQADFMREYHVLCNRPDRVCRRCGGVGSTTFISHVGEVKLSSKNACTRCKGKGTYTPAKSSFVDNFGRFVHHISWGRRNVNTAHYAYGHVGDDDARKPYACLAQEYTHDDTERRLNTDVKRSLLRGSKHNVLRWTKPAPDELLKAMADKKLHEAFSYMERTMLEPTKSDDAQEIARWVGRLSHEMTRRSHEGRLS